MLCIFMQFIKKLVFSMVSAIYKFGKNIILPNLQGIFRCFRSVKPVVYAVHAQSMQRHAVGQSGFRQRGQLGVRPRGQSATARAGVWCVFCSAFPGVPLPPSPPGCRKNGAALRRRPMRYDTQPFETSRQTSPCSTFIASLSQVHRTTFSRISKGIPYIIWVICI